MSLRNVWSAVVLVLASALAVPARAQTQVEYTQSTIRTNPAFNALGAIQQVADAQGNIYITSTMGSGTGVSVFKESPNATGGYTETALPFTGTSIYSLAINAQGTFYFSIGSNNLIQIATPAGVALIRARTCIRCRARGRSLLIAAAISTCSAIQTAI